MSKHKIDELDLKDTRTVLNEVEADKKRDACGQETGLFYEFTSDGKLLVTIEPHEPIASKTILIDGKDSSGERWVPKVECSLADLVGVQNGIQKVINDLIDHEMSRLTPVIKDLVKMRDQLSYSRLPTNELPKPEDCVALEFNPWCVDYETF